MIPYDSQYWVKNMIFSRYLTEQNEIEDKFTLITSRTKPTQCCICSFIFPYQMKESLSKVCNIPFIVKVKQKKYCNKTSMQLSVNRTGFSGGV